MKTAMMAEKKFDCQGFYISSIRDIAVTQDYWKDTKETLNLEGYFKAVQNFVKNYNGRIPRLHIARRGIIIGNKQKVTKCRFGNIFPDNKKIICPLDISKKLYSKELMFNKRPCNKNKECILQKIVLEKVTS